MSGFGRGVATMLMAAAVLAGGDWTGVERAQAAQEKKDSQDEQWQKEFDDVCSKTTDAMTLSLEELTSLVKRCDALQPRIEKLDETRRKVYLRRLAQCRGLYAYVYESKSSEKK